ncbi:MAG TPA: hypothetical protein VF736_13575 [Pyrinomonadaceae bacterium]
MGIPLDIFSLYRLRGEGAACLHHLLLRVGRPAYSNADEGDYSRAARAADEKLGELLGLYEACVLAVECGARHAAELAGELQSRPVGDGLAEGGGGFYVDLWVAETRFGRPWVVLGTAETEEEFWRELRRDEDLSGLNARPPAERLRAYFLAEGEAGATRAGVSGAEAD